MRTNIFRQLLLVAVTMILCVGNAQAATYKVSLTVSSGGNGSVFAATTNDKPSSFTSGTALSATGSSGGNAVFYLWATPNAGYYFSSWTPTKGKGTITIESSSAATTTATCKYPTSSSYDSRTSSWFSYTYTNNYTATANFAKITLTAPGDVTITPAPTNAQTSCGDYTGTLIFTASHSCAEADFNDPVVTKNSGNGILTVTSLEVDGTQVKVNYKFTGNNTYGGDDHNRANSFTVTLTTKADESASCNVTADFPNVAISDGNAETVYPLTPSVDVAGSAVFPVTYSDGAGDFTASISGATGGTWIPGTISFASTNAATGAGNITVPFTFNAGGATGDFSATLTLTATNAGGATKTITLTASAEPEAENDVRVTEANGDLVDECDWATAISTYQAAGRTFTLLRNINLGTITATNNITKAITIDLNGKELRAAVNATSIGVLTITAAVPVTIKDSRTGGKIINEIARNSEIRTIFVNKAGATLTLESGTIAVNNLGQYASAAATVDGVAVAKYASCSARVIHQIAGSTVNINGGRVEAIATRAAYSIVQASSVATNKAGTTVLNINGGEVYAEAAYQAYGVYAYGLVNMAGGVVEGHTNTDLVDAAKGATTSPNLRNGNARGLELAVGTANATATSNYFATLNMTGGTVKAINDCVNAVDNGRAYGICFESSNVTQADASKTPDGTHSQKVTAVGQITGGKIIVNTGTYYGFGVYATSDYNSYDNTHRTIQIKNCEIDVTAHTYATGVMAYVGVSTSNGACYGADIELTNCTINATTTVGAYAEAAFVSSNYGTIYENVTPAYAGEYAAAAKLTINSGTYTSTTATTNSYCIKSGSQISNLETWSKTMYAPTTNANQLQELGGNAEAYPELVIHGGTFTANTASGKNAARAVCSGGHTIIDGGTFIANSGGNNGYGLVAISGTMKVSGATVRAEANASAYGVLVSAGIMDYTMFDYAADVELNNCDVTATTRTGTEARGVSVTATTKTQTEATRDALSAANKNKYYNLYQITEKSAAGKVKINGGTYRATAATTTAYGVLLTTTSVSTTGAASASTEGIIKNATFVVKTNGTTSATGIYAGGSATIDGCNITVQPITTTGYGVYINDKKTTLSNTTINVTTAHTDNTKSAAAYGIYNYASISSIGWIFAGELEANEGNEVNVEATTGTTAYGVYTHAVNKAITSEVYTTAGTYVAAARTTINGGKYTAHANNTTGYAVVVAAPVLGTEATGIPTCIINGGKFKGTATSTYADVSPAGEPGYFVLNGGYYVKDENLDVKLGEGMNKVAVKSGTPEYTEGYRWRVTDNMTGEYVCKIKENNTSYASLEEALQVVNATPNSTWTIIMIANYTLSKGDYVLPAKTTLLIPYQSSQTTINGASPKWVTEKGTVAPAYKLTFANGVNMTVFGKIEASSTTYIVSSTQTGIVGGPYGWLYLNEGSHIDLEFGAFLYAWGYVTGKGTINAKNGSTMYEDFQLGDWHGGGVGYNMNNNTNGLNNKGVFMVNYYYFQNIEAPITYRPGAKAIAYSGTVISSMNAPSDPVNMVGTSDAMFLMDPATAGENTWVRKEYDAETDKMIWTMNSGASLGSVKLKIQVSVPFLGNIGVDMDSKDYVLPITSNFVIIAQEGNINITNDVAFLPGTEVVVKKEATLTIPASQYVYIYDQDEWDSFSSKGYYYTLGYSPSWKVNPRAVGKTASTKLPDAKIQVEGLLDIKGKLYTTAGGANIYSTRENSGKILFNAAPPASTSAKEQFSGNKGNTTLCQAVGTNGEGGTSTVVYYNGKALNPAWLKNEDGTYSKPTSSNTSSGDTWVYMQSLTSDTYEWTKALEDGCFTVRSTGDTKTYVHPSDWVAVGDINANHAYPSEDGTRMVVNAEAATSSKSCVWWEVNPSPEVIDGVTYYVANNENFDNYGTYYYWDNTISYWKPKKITVTWQNEDGTKITNGTYGDEYNFNTSPQFFGTNPKKTSTAIEKYDWIGWRDAEGNIYDQNATLPRATSDVTYTAYFNATKYRYTITFKNDDNSDLWAGLVDAGTTGAELQALFETKYNEKTGSTIPLKASSVDRVYTFSSWNTPLATVTAAATYTAKYTWVTRQYTVTFLNYNAVDELYSAEVAYNTRPVYPDDAVRPFRANTSAYSYNWTGWQQGTNTYGKTAALPVVTGDISYIATFEQTELKYQVFFKRQDGSIIDAPFFTYEETPAAFPANPTMASTVSTDYTFREWSPATLVPVTEDGMVYTALFDESPRQYTAHFVNYNGTSLNADQTIDYNTVPAYTGVTPMKPNDSRNSYVFSGWAWAAGDGWEAGSIGVGEAFPAIKGEMTFTAQYTPTLLQFDVIYQREDGFVILRDKKKWGESSAFPTTYIGATSGLNYEDATYSYTFDHWSPATVVNPVTTNATYTAYYNQSIKTYSITAVGISPAGYGSVSPASLSGIPADSKITVDGNKLTVNGSTITATPAAADAQYTYTFDHWNNVPATITGNISTIEAVFTRTVNTYTVTWKNTDGTVLETDENVDYGTTPTYDGETPTKDADASYVYTFNTWTPAVGAISGDATYTATYNTVPTVASVTVSGNTTYYASVADAITFANGKTDAVVTILQDDAVESEITISAAMTIDLNGKTISSTNTTDIGVFKISASGKTVTIRDSGTNGKISRIASSSVYMSVINLDAGSLSIKGGTIYAENTNATSNTAYRAIGIYNKNSNAISLSMSGGTIEAKRPSTYAYGMYLYNTNCTLTVSGGEIKATGTSGVRGIYQRGGKATLSNTTITATATVAGDGNGYALFSDNSAKFTINSGTYTATATGAAKDVYAIYAKNASVSATVNGGQFSGKSKELEKTAGTFTLKGGYYVHNTDLEANCATNYHVLPLTGEDPYMYEVAEAYTITFKNGDDVLQSTAVKKGTMPVYSGEEPSKAADAQYTYAFTGWSPAITTVSAAATYTATYSSTPRTYTVTLNTNGGTINADDVTEYTYGTGATLPTNVTKDGHEFGGWFDNSGLTGDAVTSISNTATGNKEYWAKWTASIVDRELDIVDWTSNSITINVTNLKAVGGTNKNNWKIYVNDKDYTRTSPECSTQSRTLTISGLSLTPNDNLLIQLKNDADVIESQHNYKIPQIYTANATLSGTKEESVVYVYGGKLTISGNTTLAALYVCPGAEVEVTGGTLTVGKLMLRTKPWATAAISGSVEATNIYYTRIAPDGSDSYPTGKYYQFGLPYECAISDVRLSDGTTPAYNTTWILKSYNEERRATKGATGENWDALAADATIEAGRGYEMFSSYKYYREYYFPVIPTDNTSVAVTRHGTDQNNSGWNIVCSPLMSVYENKSNPVDGLKVSWLLADGSYDQAWPETIWPALPFSYQASATGYLDFSTNALNQAVSAPRRAAYKDNIQTEWLHLDVKNANGVGDHTSIFAHPDRFDATYETGIDVAKQSFTASRALIYSSHVYGEMAFAGLPDSLLEHGVALTVYSPINQELTISMRENNWLNRMAYVLLIDKETGAQVDLMNGNYTFEALEGTMRGRFFIQCVFNAETPEISTGVNHLDTENDKAQKIVYKNKIYIIYQGRVYDMTGRQCELR